MPASIVSLLPGARYGAGDIAITLDGSGVNRCVVMIASAQGSLAPSLDSATLDGQAADYITTDATGTQGSWSLAFWKDAKHPGAGSFNFNVGWSASQECSIIVIESQDVEQLNPIAGLTANDYSDVTSGTTFDVTLSGATGKQGVCFVCMGSLNFWDSTLAESANLSNEVYSDNTRAHTLVWLDNSVDSASEDYSVTFTKTNGSDPKDAYIGAFYFNNVITGPNISGPSSATENASVNVTGTVLDSITTLKLKTADNASNVIQSQDTVTATQVTIDDLNTGFEGALNGSVTEGVPMVTTVNADGYTAHSVLLDADSDTDGSSIAISISPRSGYVGIQAMTTGADAANTVDGESLFANEIIDVEDNMQVFASAQGSLGANLTYLADGTFSSDSGESQTIDAIYWSPSTGQYSKSVITIGDSNTRPTITPIADQEDTVGDSVSLQVDASDADPGALLLYSASGLPDGLSINSSSGLITGTLTTAEVASVTVTVADQFGLDVDDSFSWTVNALDDVPDSFSFTAVTGAEVSTATESNTVTVSGLGTGVSSAISITGGEFAIDTGGGFGSWLSSASTVNNGDVVKVRATSSASYATQVTATLTIGGVGSAFNVTTRAADITPSAFAFNDVTGAAVSTVIESNTITVAGMDAGVNSPVTVIGGEYRIDGGSWVSSSGNIQNGQTIQVRQTSSAQPGILTTVTLDINGVSDVFNVTTVSGSAVEPIDARIYMQPAADDGYPTRLYEGNTNYIIVSEIYGVVSGENLSVSTITASIKLNDTAIFGPVDMQASGEDWVISVDSAVAYTAGDSVTVTVDILTGEGGQGSWEIPVAVSVRDE